MILRTHYFHLKIGCFDFTEADHAHAIWNTQLAALLILHGLVP